MNTPLQNRVAESLQRQMSLELKTDPALAAQKNLVMIIAGTIALEAVEDNILVAIDKFKTGYECKNCDETGLLQRCSCEVAGRAGETRFGTPCADCGGQYEQLHGKTCKFCHGKGVTLEIPQSAKSIPTSGVIVSVGPLVSKRSVGERILFGAHTGYYLPFKGQVNIKVMREDEPLCLIHMIDKEASLNNFVQLEDS